jgi:quercetin dioxygenase-like cupin family protein
LVLLLGLPVRAAGQAARDAVSVDPTHHHVILENDHVRVFEVMAAPGARSAMHTHPPTAVISLGAARARTRMGDGTTGLFDLHPGQVFWVESAEHAWELVSGNAHVIGVEVKAARQGRAPAVAPLGPRDAVAVDPTHHNVILENDHVRVLEAIVSPGARSAMHTHPPLVGVSLGTARLRMTAPDGAVTIFDLHPGQVFWIDGTEHAWELLAGQAHVVAVEVKAARPAAGRR